MAIILKRDRERPRNRAVSLFSQLQPPPRPRRDIHGLELGKSYGDHNIFEMEEDIREKQKKILAGTFYKYDLGGGHNNSSNSINATPEIPSGTFLEAWYSMSKKGALRSDELTEGKEQEENEEPKKEKKKMEGYKKEKKRDKGAMLGGLGERTQATYLEYPRSYP